MILEKLKIDIFKYFKNIGIILENVKSPYINRQILPRPGLNVPYYYYFFELKIEIFSYNDSIVFYLLLIDSLRTYNDERKILVLLLCIPLSHSR